MDWYGPDVRYCDELTDALTRAGPLGLPLAAACPRHLLMPETSSKAVVCAYDAGSCEDGTGRIKATGLNLCEAPPPAPPRPPSYWPGPSGIDVWWGCEDQGRAGLTDRRTCFRWLMDLATLFGGSSCMCGGVSSTERYLSPRHTDKTASSWSHYFDTDANGGEPWRADACPDEASCYQISTVETLLAFYDGTLPREGIRCVSIRFSPWHGLKDTALGADYRGERQHGVAGLLTSMGMVTAYVPESQLVARTAQRILRKLRAENSGVVHIRRADFFDTVDISDDDCSSVENVLQLMRDRGLDSWIVMLYVSEGDNYREELEHAANNAGSPHLRLIFESEFVLPLDDNYFVYAVGVHLMQLADQRGACLEMRHCRIECGGLW